jgi:Pao retrotransposon peptidase
VKQVSIPRLELCGEQLLVKLMKKVKELFNQPKIECFAWTDSTIVLAWLAEVPRKWKTFVANRTFEILMEFPYNHWHHVKSGDNPADIASRGAMPVDLHTNNLWWYGPNFLATEPLDIGKKSSSSKSELQL